MAGWKSMNPEWREEVDETVSVVLDQTRPNDVLGAAMLVVDCPKPITKHKSRADGPCP